MLGVVAERFLRTEWKSVQDLATELHAIFRQPLDISPGSITITQPPGVADPPIQINQPIDSTTPTITVNRGGTTSSGGGSGGTDLGSINFPGQVTTERVLAVPVAQNTPFSLYGEVQSKVEGSTYRVKCWAKSPLSFPPIGILNVRQALINEDDTIPPNTPVIVIAFPGDGPGGTTIVDAIMQVPVFLNQDAT